jgi:hypothetical protein
MVKKKTRDTCLKPKLSRECHASPVVQTIQPFPADGLLAKNLNLPLPVLKMQIGETQGRTCSYVVRSVRLDQKAQRFEQHGSAPNFQGDVLTLCTCKHQMRASLPTEKWGSVWIVGFTSRTIHEGRHWLFYLAQIESAYESHADLWMATKAKSRNAKAAHAHFLGDLFKPKTPIPTGNARFSHSRYISPNLHAHRTRNEDGWHNGWHNDINYRHAETYRHPALLVADPRRTFLWEEPTIYLNQKHCRNFFKWPSLQKLFSQLTETGR